MVYKQQNMGCQNLPGGRSFTTLVSTGFPGPLLSCTQQPSSWGPGDVCGNNFCLIGSSSRAKELKYPYYARRVSWEELEDTLEQPARGSPRMGRLGHGNPYPHLGNKARVALDFTDR